ncbi:hypothetical protein [Bosea sp. AS-1]|uniref:hypothetical protein n=1 Tax=Bosea sp. AS-1 TaxID=2015316 RepID=UPI000B76F21E|nr:hypothetical protein [Bosea sp. AS-1]
MTPANDNRPVFVDRKTAAAMLMISVDTFDLWLRQGFIPPANVNRGQIVRWHWPSVEQKLVGVTATQDEGRKMMEGPYVRKRRNA